MKIYLVGGAVRDKLLGLPVSDRDWVVVGSTPAQLIAQGYQQIGLDFPVFLHPKTQEEYALARTERKSGSGYSGFVCYAASDVTLEEDLLRRDLTINAIAQNDEGTLFDPYHGIDDLHARLLRHVSPAFKEDPLRVLRVARFAARYANLGFHVAPETMTLMTQMSMSGELNTLTPERVWTETEKALQTNAPQVYFEILQQCSALPILFPEIDVDENILLILETITALSNDVNVRFAALCHTLGNDRDRSEIRIALINTLCDRFRIPNYPRDLARLAARYYNHIHIIAKLPANEIVAIFDGLDAWRKPERVEQLAIISESNSSGVAAEQNQPYNQRHYFLTAFEIARHIPVKPIVEQGLKGEQIRQELTRQRTQAVAHWQTHQTLLPTE